MTEPEELTRDNFETVLKVSHAVKSGFGGNTSIWVAVTDETEGQIKGREFSPIDDMPGGRIVIQKDNVAGWREDQYQYRSIPEELPLPEEDTPSPNHTPTVKELRQKYLDGEINEVEFESRLDDVDDSEFEVQRDIA